MSRSLVPTIVVGALSLSASTARALPPPHVLDAPSFAPDEAAADAPAAPAATSAALSDAELAQLAEQESKTEVLLITL